MLTNGEPFLNLVASAFRDLFPNPAQALRLDVQVRGNEVLRYPLENLGPFLDKLQVPFFGVEVGECFGPVPYAEVCIFGHDSSEPLKLGCLRVQFLQGVLFKAKQFGVFNGFNEIFRWVTREKALVVGIPSIFKEELRGFFLSVNQVIVPYTAAIDEVYVPTVLTASKQQLFLLDLFYRQQ